MLEFSDGVKVDTSGKFRLLHLSDGWYVTGNGWLIPCNSLEEAKKELAEMQKTEPKNETVCGCGCEGNFD